ncbi:MAG: pyridoxamine 5'-phosphate oxidase family protein [Deltaproteobacteria bacterium]
MGREEAVITEIRELLEFQPLAVLATQAQGAPYASLVAFVASEDLKKLYFATSRSTRKYANLAADPRAALLVDSRSNAVSDFHQARAVTAVGRSGEVDDRERDAVIRRYLEKHPHLKMFVHSPTCALLGLTVNTFYLVSTFQKVMEVHMTP